MAQRFAKGVKRVRRRKREKLDGPLFRKKFCRLCQEKVDSIDYRDLKRLEKFITERGKIVPRRISGNCARHQRRVSSAIKRARHMALLPFVVE